MLHPLLFPFSLNPDSPHLEEIMKDGWDLGRLLHQLPDTVSLPYQTSGVEDRASGRMTKTNAHLEPIRALGTAQHLDIAPCGLHKAHHDTKHILPLSRTLHLLSLLVLTWTLAMILALTLHLLTLPWTL
jgi:hypothetical protein